MSSKDIIVRISNISKCYEIYQNPGRRLLQMFWPKDRHFYEEFWALKNINFELNRGECLGIIGRNGAGKSTLLQVITGILRPTTGTVEVQGKVAALLELGSGFNPEFTGRENIYMNASILGLTQKEITKRMKEILDFAGIGDFVDKPVKIYSSGMMLRLAFAVQIVIEPDLLIVDEALAVGDASFQFKCMSRIKRLIAHGTSVLLVSHDTQTIKSFCDKCLWVEKGNVVDYGEAGKIADDYEREIRKEIEQGQREERESTSKKNADEIESGLKVGKNDNSNIWYEDTLLDNKSVGFRYGNGEIKVKGIKLLNLEEQDITSVEFNQKVIIRICFEVFQKKSNVVVCYITKDAKQIPLIGYESTSATSGKMYDLEIGKYVIDFTTHMPLTAGIYSISIVISRPTIKDIGAVSFDYMDNTLLFTVNPRKPDRIWTMLQIENDVNIRKI